MKNGNINSYTFQKLFFNIRIKPDIIVGFKTPINLITELNNNKKGYQKLEEIHAVEKLLSYFENINEKIIDINATKIKSVFWILIKLLLKKTQGKILQDKYKIMHKISKFYNKCNDYSMKGTIIYLTSFCAQNEELKSIVNSFHTSYFFNTNICYPSIQNLFYVENDNSYENERLNQDFNIIDSKINLDPISDKIYENVSNLINNITFKQSILNLDEIYRINKDYFLNPNLFVKINAILSKYKLKESARRAIMTYFEKCIFSSEIALKSSHLLKSIDNDLLIAHKLE